MTSSVASLTCPHSRTRNLWLNPFQRGLSLGPHTYTSLSQCARVYPPDQHTLLCRIPLPISTPAKLSSGITHAVSVYNLPTPTSTQPPSSRASDPLRCRPESQPFDIGEMTVETSQGNRSEYQGVLLGFWIKRRHGDILEIPAAFIGFFPECLTTRDGQHSNVPRRCPASCFCVARRPRCPTPPMRRATDVPSRQVAELLSCRVAELPSR